MTDPKDKAAGLGGIMIIGCAVAGAAGLLIALLALLNEHDYSAAGMALLASAVAFGLGANAVFRQ